MSNQRSCILFIALVIILSYLYYESFIQKKAQSKGKLLIESSSYHTIPQKEEKVLFGRRLLSYSTEDTAESPQQEKILRNLSNSLKLKTLNKLPDTGQEFEYRKRIKRNARKTKGFYKWKFNVSVSRLNNEFTTLADDFQNSLDEKAEEALNVEIYVAGKNKQFKTVEHSLSAVQESLRNFYKEPNESKENVLDSIGFSSHNSQLGAGKTVTNENLLLTSSENSFPLIIQKSSEKSVQVETERTTKSSRGRKGKFLFLDFGGGGNKENPPLEPGIGGNMVSKSTFTESMHDLTFVNSTEQFDIIKISDPNVFSSTLLPEHQELDRPVAEPILSFTTTSEPKLDSKEKLAKHSTPNPTVSNDLFNCSDCIIQETKPSIKLETVPDVKKAGVTNINAWQTVTLKSIIDISPASIERFCINFVQKLLKSPRFEDEVADIGSGRMDTDDKIENINATDTGSEVLNIKDEIESLRITTQTVTTIKTAQQQLGLLQRLWNRLPNFGSRHQRNIDEDLDISGFPPDFSVQDCKSLFADQIKSDSSTHQTPLEENILTESKLNILPFSPSILISDVEKSSDKNLDFIRKTDSVDKISSAITPDDQFQNYSFQNSNVFQNFSSVQDQIMPIIEASTINIVPLKQAELISNSENTALIESSLRTEESVKNPEVSILSDSNETEALTTIPSRKDTLIDTKSVIPFSLESAISSSTPEDFEVVPSEIVIQENKRFFSDLNNDDILELGSSDEQIKFDIGIAIKENELKEITFDPKTSPVSQERIFIPNFGFFSEGSGARELPETDISTVINMDKNELSFLEENESVHDSILLEETNALKETTVDLVQTPLTKQERRFIPNILNLFGGSSVTSEIPESIDVNINKNELSSKTNEQSVSDNILLEDTNALKETTVDLVQTPLTKQERRFIPNILNLFGGSSVTSEIPESIDVNINKNELSSETNGQSVSDNLLLEDTNALKETTVDLVQTPVTKQERRFIPNILNLFGGSSVTSEIPESIDVNINKNELSSETNEQSVSDNILLEDTNALKETTVDLVQTPVTKQERRFIPNILNLFGGSSVTSEIPESIDVNINKNELSSETNEQSVSDNILLEDTNALKETTVDLVQTPVTKQERRFIPNILNLFGGSSVTSEIPESIDVNINKNELSSETNEQSVSDNILLEDTNALKETTIDLVQTPVTKQERRFIPNILNLFGGSSVTSEIPQSTDVNINKNELSSETNEQSVSNSTFLEGGVALKETTVDRMETTPIIIQERRFIQNIFNLFSGGSVTNESPESIDNNINKDELLSETNHQSISDSTFIEGADTLKVTTFDSMETPMTNQERRLIPNFFSAGSGAREVTESTDINMTEKDLSLSETDDQSVSDRIFLEKIDAFKETVDLIQTPLTDQERMFIPNFFNAGSGARELNESTDIDVIKEELGFSVKKDQSASESIFMEDVDPFNEITVDVTQMPLTDEERRFIPNFFSAGSGARELPESYSSSDIIKNKNELIQSKTNDQNVSASTFMELSEEEISSSDIRIDSALSVLEPLDEGSGERKHDGIEFSTEIKDLNISALIDKASFSKFPASSSIIDDLINKEKVTDILSKTQTNPPELSVHREAFMDEFGSGESFAQKNDDSDQDFSFRSSGDGRAILIFPDDCDPCNYIEGENSDSFDVVPVELSVNTQTNDTLLLPVKESPNKNQPQTKEKTNSVISNSQASEAVNSTIASTFNKNDSRFINLLINSEVDALDNNQIFFEPEPEISVHITNPTQPSRGARFDVSQPRDFSLKLEGTHHIVSSNFNKNHPSSVRSVTDKIDSDPIHFNSESEISVQSKAPQPRRGARFDDLLPDGLDFIAKLETINGTSSSSHIRESGFDTFLKESELNKLHNDEVHFEPKPEISAKPSNQPSRRGARFDNFPPGTPDITLKSDSVIPDTPITLLATQSEISVQPSKLPLPSRGARFNDWSSDMPDRVSKLNTAVPEVPFTLQPTQFVNLFQSRRGRGHDVFDLDELDSAITESVSKQQTEPSTLGTLEEDSQAEIIIKNEMNHTLIAENVEENSETHSTDLSGFFDAFSSKTPRIRSEPLPTTLSDHSSETSSIQPASSTSKLYPVKINLNPELKFSSVKFCHSASECNVTLNERCMPNDDVLLCDCGRAFRRNLETKICEATYTLQTSITLPGERFYEDLRNRNTKFYQRKKMVYIQIMWFLLKHDPKLFRIVADVDIASFEEGSLVVKYTMKLLDNGKETASELVELLEEDLNKIIRDQDLRKNISIQLNNASISSFVLNPCLSSDMNYCHKNAICIPTEEKGFRCQCKPDYLDTSKDKRHPGENCTGFCAIDFCGVHGECHVKDNGEKQCICDGWYFGEKCEIYGAVVIAGFAFANVLVIVLVVLVVFFCKKKKNHKLYNRNLTNFQPGQDLGSGHPRARDAIALDEVVHSRMSKFVAISTPMYEVANPVIQVTSPSFPGSSIEYDSTFDRTPYDSETSRNESDILQKV